MYVVANKKQIPLKEVDEKEGWKLNLGFMDVEMSMSPWVLTGIITLVLLIIVLLYWSLSAVDTKPPMIPAAMPAAVAAPIAMKAAPKVGGKKGKAKKGRK